MYLGELKGTGLESAADWRSPAVDLVLNGGLRHHFRRVLVYECVV